MICPSCRTENEPGAEVCFTCRSVLSAVTQGTLVAGRYEILSFLGRGGMGAVYRARDRLLEEIVALKILRADVAGSEEMARRFRGEIKLARKVSHPNVCRIHEYGEEGSLRFISMELVEGRSLRELLDGEGRVETGRACEIAAQVAEGLQAIHAAGVIHRDLKPPNVMLDAHGRVRLMDFGIAKQLTGADAPTTEYVLGSPEYMSPEQGRGRQVDARSDLYSLGVVLFELLTGSVPFRGDTPVATLLMHVEREPPLDGPVASRIPEPVRVLLRRALAKEPEERYASAREMGGVLRGLAGGPAPTPSWPARRPSASGWRRVGILAALAAVTVIALVTRRREDPGPHPVAPPPRGASAPPVLASQTPPTVQPSASQPAPGPASAGPPSTSAPRTTSTATPLEAPLAAPVPQPSSPPTAASPSPSNAPTPEPAGMLAVAVSPWADVEVDGVPVGQTPLRPLALPAGAHSVLLTHPEFQPYPRRVTIRPGETYRLQVDLRTDAVRRRPR